MSLFIIKMPALYSKQFIAYVAYPFIPQIETTAFVRFIDDDASSEAEEKLGCFEMKIKLVDDPNAPTDTRVDNQEEDE